MAEGGVEQNDFVICSLCLGTFKDPRALPCLHTFCLKCLVGLDNVVRGLTVLKCPICQEGHEMPQNGVYGFRQDFRIKNFLEMHGKTSASNSRDKTVMCPKHSKYELMYLCTTCGRVNLCKLCWTRGHLNHNIVRLNEVEKKGFEQENHQLQSCKATVRRYTSILGSLRERLQRNKVEAKEKIAARVREYKVMLSNLELEICNDVDKITEEQLSFIDKKQEEVFAALGKLQDREADLNRATVFANLSNTCLIAFIENWNLGVELPIVDMSSPLSSDEFRDVDPAFSFVKTSEINIRVIEEESEIRLRGTVKAEEMCNWKHDCNIMQGMACHNIGGEGLTILSSSQIKVYEQSTGNLFYSEDHNHENIGDATVFGERNHAIVDMSSNEIYTYNYWPLHFQTPEHTISIKGKASWSLSGTQNHLVYGSRQKGLVCIVCISMEGGRPKLKWNMTIDPWTQERCLNAMEIRDQLIVLVANSCTGGRLHMHDDALVAIDGENQLWTVRYEDLDIDTERFDLLDISNDGLHFYVLNTRAGCIYLLSADGRVLSKVLQNLVMPLRICINRKTKTLVLARKATQIAVYKLTYE